ncbi:OLC1v1029359C1 [Oldenlandia corymbosa var. corymbosa]|uniref:OLC1v1029359C1 n=1 Tax=Oldenlandia corymbosa var. corymbosa TaxID=529605 RepID=A0AAV1CH30_OLDCO|nr:OLC1v1029359C1 [Oldenlandia corymbosa var. corymbosa]
MARQGIQFRSSIDHCLLTDPDGIGVFILYFKPLTSSLTDMVYLETVPYFQKKKKERKTSSEQGQLIFEHPDERQVRCCKHFEKSKIS